MIVLISGTIYFVTLLAKEKIGREAMEKKRILTGDRPTGRLHIGHYFGSLKK